MSPGSIYKTHIKPYFNQGLNLALTPRGAALVRGMANWIINMAKASVGWTSLSKVQGAIFLSKTDCEIIVAFSSYTTDKQLEVVDFILEVKREPEAMAKFANTLFNKTLAGLFTELGTTKALEIVLGMEPEKVDDVFLTMIKASGAKKRAASRIFYYLETRTIDLLPIHRYFQEEAKCRDFHQLFGGS